MPAILGQLICEMFQVRENSFHTEILDLKKTILNKISQIRYDYLHIKF